MTENRDRRVSLWVLVLVAMAALVILSETSKGQTIDGRNSNDQNTIKVGDGSISDDTLALGFSSPSFGAAIAQCVATEASSFAFGAYGKQKVSVNYWCMGSSLRQMGLYDAAARVWCERTDLGDLYPSPEQCHSALSFVPETPVDSPPVVTESDIMELEDLHAEELEEQQMLLADMQAKLMNLETELNRPVQQIVREVPALTDDQQQALRELKDGELD